MWKRKRKIEEKKEEKEESLLKELCGDDTKLYDVLGSLLYLDPIAAIPKRDLDILIEEAEKSITDKNYQEAQPKYRLAVDKAIFEATQNPGERARYVKVIQDLASKKIHSMEKAKAEVETKGLTDYAASRRIKEELKYEFIRERIEDVINVATHFYNEKLEMLAETGRQRARSVARREMEREERQEEQKAKETRRARSVARREMGREERREAERDEKKIEKMEKESREERQEERREAERDEKKIEKMEKESREERRKERREARRKETA